MAVKDELVIESPSMADQAVVNRMQLNMGTPGSGGHHENPVWAKEVGAYELAKIVADPVSNIRQISGVPFEDDCHVILTGTYNYHGGLRSQDDWRAVISGVRGLNVIQVTAM